ncbi:MAG: hypothetical protein ACREO3_05265, partial [Arenimonas sp.]
LVRAVAGEGDGERYAYRVLRGDPFGLMAAGAAPGSEREFAEADVFAATLTAARPDPLRRVWRAFHGEVGHPATLLLSLSDGHEVGNPMLRKLTNLRGGHHGTHGSMTRRASTGVIASTWRDVTDVNTSGAHALLYGERIDAAARQALGLPADAMSAR